jgi:hypothetical protein
MHGYADDMAAGDDWTATELNAIVADYFAMLGDEIRGTPFNKAAHNRELQKTVARSHASIEFKHCNITAVLEELGVTGITGYKRRDNYQGAILNAIERYLDRTGARDLSAVPEVPRGSLTLVDIPIPRISNTPRVPGLAPLVRRFDPVERDLRNRELGLAGELAVLDHERHWLADRGRGDLSQRVRHVSVEIGDGLGYDISSFTDQGVPKLIEVKTTRGGATTPFFMSRNERERAEHLADSYHLYRVHQFGPKTSSLFMLRPPLDGSVRFSTEVWRAEIA